MVINLPRHLEQVEKIVRDSDEWKDIMAITDVPTPKKIDGTDFGIFADHPQSELNSIFIFPCMFMFKTIINLKALHRNL